MYFFSTPLSAVRTRLKLVLNSLALVLSLLVCMTGQAEEPANTTATANFETAIIDMAQASVPKRGGFIDKAALYDDERLAAIFTALLEGKLYFAKGAPAQVATARVAIIQNDSSYLDAFSGKPISQNTDAFKRIPITNAMRNQLRSLNAQLNINNKQASVRHQAVLQMIGDGLDSSSIKVLKTRLNKESDSQVREAITTAVAINNLHNLEEQVRLDAVQLLRGSLLQEARIALGETAAKDASAKVKEQAQRALDSINDKVAMYRFGENLFFGLSLGSVLLLSAIGLAITFGVMGVINMAHGEMMMIGAYVTFGVQQLFPNQIGYSLLMAIPAAFVVSGLIGIAIERGVIRFLYGRPLETLLATFGISLILQQAVRFFISPTNQAVQLPDWMSGSIAINPVLSITNNRLYIFLFGLIVFFALLLILKKTSLGLKVRAVSQNRAMARAVGVRANWVDAMTFGLGSGIAGIAGVALSQLTNVGPNLGQSYIIDSFMVVVFGGVGNLWGTLVGAMGLGMLNKFLEPFAGAVLAKVLVLVLLILFIQKKPKGLFPQKGRAAAD